MGVPSQNCKASVRAEPEWQELLQGPGLSKNGHGQPEDLSQNGMWRWRMGVRKGAIGGEEGCTCSLLVPAELTCGMLHGSLSVPNWRLTAAGMFEAGRPRGEEDECWSL